MQTLTVPQGTFQLARYPLRKNETLRAWDAADEYLLQHLAVDTQITPSNQGLIINDSYGALATALADYRPQMVSDSFLSQQGTLTNLARNQIDMEQAPLLDSLTTPQGPLDWVLIKIPKSHALLEDQLYRLRPLLHPQTSIIAAGMVKSIHTNTLKLFERIVGPTHTSLAKKKARLIFCQPDLALQPGTSPYPQNYTLEGTDYRIINHANVFSRERLDIGTRLLLQHIPASTDPLNIIDLGCGNGVIGLIAAEQNPNAKITFVDESYMAIASAQSNFETAFGPSRSASYHVTDCLNGIPMESADLILNNPPFHQQHAVGDFIAWQMFSESQKVLRTGGELRVIGNRHLGYHTKLKRLFGNCRLAASNKKFVLLSSIKK